MCPLVATGVILRSLECTLNEPLGAKGLLLVGEEVRNKDIGKVESW